VSYLLTYLLATRRVPGYPLSYPAGYPDNELPDNGSPNGDIYIYPRLTPIEPRCHGNEIWDKIRYNSACVTDICEIFAPIGGFREWAIECCQSHFPPTDPRCHGNEIWA